jgi:hypothetical protein
MRPASSAAPKERNVTEQKISEAARDAEVPSSREQSENQSASPAMLRTEEDIPDNATGETQAAINRGNDPPA